MFLKQRFSLDLSYRVALLPDYQPLLEKITRQMQPFLWIFLLFGCFQTLLFKIHATLLTVYEEKGCIRHLLAFKEVFCIKNSLPVPLYSSNSAKFIYGITGIQKSANEHLTQTNLKIYWKIHWESTILDIYESRLAK